MNDLQRQILADRLNIISQNIVRYNLDIAKLEKQLENKQQALASLESEKAQLEEGIDW